MPGTTYVAFLRAINLGAKRKFGKDDIVRCVEGAGFDDVATHINTGNVRFTSRMRSRSRIEGVLERAFEADRGFPVPTIVFRADELAEVVAHAERVAEGHEGRHYVSLLKDEPTAGRLAALEALSTTDEVAKVGGRAVHLLIRGDYHSARLTNDLVERHLGTATNRNLTVLEAIVAKWC